MKKFHAKSGNKVLALVLTAAMVLGLAGCGSTEMPAGSADDATVEGTSEAGAAGEAAFGEKIVNIGVTDSLGSINPFVIDQTFINKYAVDLRLQTLHKPELHWLPADLPDEGRNRSHHQR